MHTTFSLFIMEYNSAIHKKNLSFATTWNDLEGIMQSEISESGEDILYDLKTKKQQQQENLNS